MLPTAFDRWLAATLDREGTFTMFLILFAEAPGTIVPLRSSYLHVIGPDLRWDELMALIAQGTTEATLEGAPEGEPGWYALAVFAAKAPTGGPLPDAEARGRLVSLEQAVLRDRLTVRRGELFDRLGRRLDLSLAPN